MAFPATLARLTAALALFLATEAPAQVAASAPAPVAAAAAPKPAALEIVPGKPSARPGETVSFAVRVLNRSDKPLRIKTRQVFLNLRLDVRQPDGTCCVYNPYHRLRVNPVESFEWAEIQPGQGLEIARISPVIGEPFETRAWQTYKVRGRVVDWFERYPLLPDGRLAEESDLPKPFTLKGVHNLHASYAFPSKEPGVVTQAESAVVDFTVAP